MKINWSLMLLGCSSLMVAMKKPEPVLFWGKVTNNTKNPLLLQRTIWDTKTNEETAPRTLREVAVSPAAQELSIPIRWDTTQGELFADFAIQNKNVPQDKLAIWFTYDNKKDAINYSIIADKKLIAKGVIENVSKQPAGFVADLIFNGSLKDVALKSASRQEQPKAEPKPSMASGSDKNIPLPKDDRPEADPAVYRKLNVPVYGTPAQILGIAPKATEVEAQKAFRKLSIQYHPDKNPEGTVPYRLIAWAYEKIKSGDRPTVAHFAYEGLGVQVNAEPHVILGVAPNATKAQIDAAYDRLAVKWGVGMQTTDTTKIGIQHLLDWAYKAMIKK